MWKLMSPSSIQKSFEVLIWKEGESWSFDDGLKSMYNANNHGKQQVMIMLSSKVIIKFLLVCRSIVILVNLSLSMIIDLEKLFLNSTIG
uniref:Uncharacterized protein n=1 Tax=Cucumis melo TaxID=3656 RepID=A0A9I9E540_CUCME